VSAPVPQETEHAFPAWARDLFAGYEGGASQTLPRAGSSASSPPKWAMWPSGARSS